MLKARTGRRIAALGACLILALTDIAAAESDRPPIALGLPLACSPGGDCWIPRRVDVDPGPGVRDHACGSMSGPDHKGTDFAIADLAAMEKGVAVVAAAEGVVRGIRDGMADVDVTRADPAAIEGRACGNGVAVAHAGGWETQYCHLRRGSVRVREGDWVLAGERLGFVGLSGDTNFPHVHLTLRFEGEVIDPFTGRPMGSGCGAEGAPLWREDLAPALAHVPAILTRVGVADAPPVWSEVQQGAYAEAVLPSDAEALVVWVEGFALERGDVVRFEVAAADGRRVFEDEGLAEADKARFFRFVGQRSPPSGFEQGAYEASVSLWRDGAVVADETVLFEIR